MGRHRIACIKAMGLRMMVEAWGFHAIASNVTSTKQPVFWGPMFAHFSKELTDIHNMAFLHGEPSRTFEASSLWH